MSNIPFKDLREKFRTVWPDDVSIYIRAMIDPNYVKDNLSVMGLIDDYMGVLDNWLLLHDDDNFNHTQYRNILRSFSAKIYFYDRKMKELYQNGYGKFQEQEVNGGMGYGGFENPTIEDNSIFQGTKQKANTKEYSTKEYLDFIDELKLNLFDEIVEKMKQELLVWVL